MTDTIYFYKDKNIKAYLIELSNKRTIQVDSDELPKVIEAIKTGSPAIVRQGIFNPSFFVSIVQDEQRVKVITERNEGRRWLIEQGEAEPEELKPLSNIFEGTEFYEQIKAKRNLGANSLPESNFAPSQLP